MKTKFFSIFVLSMLFVLFIPAVSAATNCTFTTVGNVMTLDGNCTTDATISIPDGFTLNGNGYTITGVDPAGGHFVGAVVRNGGSTAHVTNLTVTVSNLANVCDDGDNRLRGIMFEGAQGSITYNTVTGINQGASGCQEGNAIEVRNIGHNPSVVIVDVLHNLVTDYQKGGIIANGTVEVYILYNEVGASATQANLAANSVQVGFGGNGVVRHNYIEGNQWLGASDFAGTAVLIYDSTAEVSQNNIRGNADVGLYIYGNDGTFDNNRIFDNGPDGLHGDYGIINFGINNVITNNKVNGYDTPLYGVDDDTNKVVGNPNAS
jgi:hypothetical protein